MIKHPTPDDHVDPDFPEDFEDIFIELDEGVAISTYSGQPLTEEQYLKLRPLFKEDEKRFNAEWHTFGRKAE